MDPFVATVIVAIFILVATTIIVILDNWPPE